ncbi:hypothetical protein M422DRAFT_273395 [Sphaerobolus stellatus SS14]|uniref:Uncharacterized protein n=1 Tax=Sphaerobolus stellatus (strain SS14) TaxID=990650 RepID=A0A0C9T979_SPHS4|nr:hypothetical protein M422DRAFT_273395 [Sphaerobolus stellatus SS14]
MFALFAISLTLTILPALSARKFNNTGSGTIVFEEAWSTPELLNFGNSTGTSIGSQLGPQLDANLLDVHNQRLTQMDATGIDFMVLSCASPCIQGISDPATAEAMAKKNNDALAATIANNTMRFGAFGTIFWILRGTSQ